jgi:hypothetical protein
MVTPVARREAVAHLRRSYEMSERRTRATLTLRLWSRPDEQRGSGQYGNCFRCSRYIVPTLSGKVVP